MAQPMHRDFASDERGRENRQPKRRQGSLSGPLMFFLVVVTAIFVMSVFFRVSDITVEGNTHYTDTEIIRAIDIEEGDNLFFFDRFSAVSRVFAKLPYVEQVSVERSLPNKVVINVVESTALAYLELGDEQWTLDHSCKVLGKAAEGETADMIPVIGLDPGTLYIGETLTTADDNQAVVDQLAEILFQMEARGLNSGVTKLDMTDTSAVEFAYNGKFTVVLGNAENIEHKFGMFVAVMDKLLEGDTGIIDVSDGVTGHFSPY